MCQECFIGTCIGSLAFFSLFIFYKKVNSSNFGNCFMIRANYLSEYLTPIHLLATGIKITFDTLSFLCFVLFYTSFSDQDLNCILLCICPAFVLFVFWIRVGAHKYTRVLPTCGAAIVERREWCALELAGLGAVKPSGRAAIAADRTEHLLHSNSTVSILYFLLLLDSL